MIEKEEPRRVTLSEKQKELIERHGVYMENFGVPPAVARIMALLLVSDEPELTFEEIHQMLGLSKSATSTSLNFLMGTKKVEYITRPGDRRRYFRSFLPSMADGMVEHFQQMLEMGKHLKEIHSARTPNTPEFNDKLGQLIDFMEFLNIEIPALFERWKEKRN